MDTQAPPEDSSGNEALGVARFVVEEEGAKTTVVGLDSAGAEVARLELVHGRFTLSPPFTDDYNTPDVDGRKLTVKALDQEMRFETAGYEPLLDLPAQPSSHWALAEFLADPHAAAVLDRWAVRFEPFAGTVDLGEGLGLETTYTTGAWRGEDASSCNGQTSCGTAYGGTINTCGSGAAALTAGRSTQVAGTNCGLYTSSYNQVRVAQCCPAGSGGMSTTWFGEKSCPTTSDSSSTCGTVAAGKACKGCPQYPTAGGFACQVNTASTVGSCSGATVKSTSWVYYATYRQWCVALGYTWCGDDICISSGYCP